MTKGQKLIDKVAFILQDKGERPSETNIYNYIKYYMFDDELDRIINS